jgi:hypothetical protein
MRNFLLLLVSVAVLAASCNFIGGKRVRGNGNMRTEERTQTGIKGVDSYGSFDLFVSNGPNTTVKIEAEDNLLPYIETYMDGDILKIDTKDGYNLNPQRSVKIFVTAPDFRRIKSYGSGNITGENKITSTSKLDLGVTGSADIKMEVDAPQVDADISGSGNIKLNGKTKAFSSTVSGSGDVHAYDLMAEETKVRIAGSGNADVYASVSLDVSVAGSGDVRYKGAGKVNSNIAGSGGVKKVD